MRQYCVYEPQKQPKNQSSNLNNGVFNKFLRGSPAPRSMSLPFHIPFLTEKVSYPIPSVLAVEGWSGLLQAF